MTIDQLTKLSDEEARVRVALALGWTMHPRPGAVKCSSAIPEYEAMVWENNFVPPQFNGDTHHWKSLPNFTSDLNAMHAAEKTLGAKWEAYLKALYVTNGNLGWGSMPHATARQRALAFLAVTEREEG